MSRTRKPSLPPEGAAFAVPLEDGRYSACRVILGPDHDRPDDQGSVLVATSAWIGDGIPEAKDPALRPILLKTRFREELSLHWMDEPPPKSFVPIGTIKPTAKERRLPCCSSCVWEGLATDAILQWRWMNDREALLAELAERKAESQRKAEAANRERAAALKRLTLNDFARHTFFPRWPGEVPTAQLRQSRRIMKQTVQSLKSLGPGASEEQRLKVLQRCIEQFNDADERKHFIDTIEREDICEEFYLLCCACGLGHLEDLADEWREW
jgi:hypothetical protein